MALFFAGIAPGVQSCFTSSQEFDNKSYVHPNLPDANNSAGSTPTPEPTTPVNLCPLTETYPSTDANTPWATNIITLANCYACLNAASLTVNTPITTTACNDSRSQQYWHWGNGQLFAESAKSLCIAANADGVSLQLCTSPNSAWGYRQSFISNTTSLCLQANGDNTALTAEACDATNTNQMFALAHLKLTDLVNNAGATVSSADIPITHGVVVENAQDFNCLQLTPPDGNGYMNLRTEVCDGAPEQQWVFNGNQLSQNGSCLAGVSGDVNTFLLQTCTRSTDAVWRFDGSSLINTSLPTPCLQSSGGVAIRVQCSGATNQMWFLGGN